MQEKYWENLTPRGLNIYQKTDDREKTDKDELLNPQQLNQFLRAIDSTCKQKYVLRNEAFFYTLWNTGARVGGVRNIKAEDVTLKDEVVEVTVPAWKDSPKRPDLPLYFAAPVLKRYVQTLPEDQEYLFHNREGKPIGYKGIKNIADNVWQELEDKEENFNVKYQGQPLHVFRKSFKTYAAIMDLLGPDESDIWTGHALGSTQIKQIYDRRDTASAGSQMRSALGLETTEETDWKQKIAPQKCQACGQQNSSHRTTCFSCGGVLKPEDLPGKLTEKETVDIEKQIEKLDLSEEQLKSLVELGEKL
jgi:integrase